MQNMVNLHLLHYKFASEVRTMIRSEHLGMRYERARIRFGDWLGRACDLYAERVVPSGQGLPGIVHCVGGGQRVSGEDLLFWAKQGFACASFDWQIGDIAGRTIEEQSCWPEGVVPQGAPAQNLEQFLIPLAVQAAQATLSWLAEDSSVDPARLGMSGISWGGYLTWVAAAYDRRIQATVPVYGCGIFDKEGRPRTGLETMDPSVADCWIKHWDPLALAARQTAPACFLTGTNDFFGPIDRANELLRNLRVNFRWSCLPNADHSIGAGESALASAWMQHHLCGGPPVPKAPVLSESYAILSDEEFPAPSSEIWWTPGGSDPMFSCWHEGLPPSGAARWIFARAHYESGLTICSPIVDCGTPKNIVERPASWADLRAGLGWRWELGSTQFHSNEVILQPLDGGSRLRITPAPKLDQPIAVLLRQISDPGWRPRAGEAIEIEWRAQDEAKPCLEFIAVFSTRGIEGERPAKILAADSGFRILPPDGLSWNDVFGLRIISRAARQTFILGPLRKQYILQPDATGDGG